MIRVVVNGQAVPHSELVHGIAGCKPTNPARSERQRELDRNRYHHTKGATA